MRIRRRANSAAAAAFILLSATTCLAQASVRDACGTVVLPPGIGQSSTPQAVTSLDWLLTNSIYNLEAIDQIYRPLVWLDRSLDYDPAMSLASAVTTPDRGRTWELTLKPWLWSDGVPITAQDVVFTFDLIRWIGPGFINYDVGGIPDLLDRVVALSPHQVEIRLTRRVNPDWFLHLGLGGFKPLPEHVYRGLDLVALRGRQTDPSLFSVSDGPFLLKQWDVARHLTLVPNPRFGGQHPRIRRLVLDFLQGGNPLQSLRANETDAATVPFQLWDLARRLAGFRTETMGGPLGFMSIILNFRSRHAPFLNDVRVRQAIAAAVDQKEIIRLAFHGQAQETHGPVPIALTKYLSPRAKAGYRNLGYDPAHAAALLDQAGWNLRPDGLRWKDGMPLAFDVAVSAGAPPRLIALQVVQRNLRAIGMLMTIRGIEFNQLLATLAGNGHDWDGIVLLWTINSYPDVQEWFATGGVANYGHYHSARMDQLTDAVMTQPGFGALDAVQDYTAEQQPFIFLPEGRNTALVANALHGVALMSSPTGSWAAENLRLSGPRACPVSPEETAQALGGRMVVPRRHGVRAAPA